MDTKYIWKYTATRRKMSNSICHPSYELLNAISLTGENADGRQPFWFAGVSKVAGENCFSRGKQCFTKVCV